MILITGAAGFIGTHLCESMCDVCGLDKRPIAANCDRKLTIDITDAAAMADVAKQLKHADISICIHLAAIASPPIAAKDPQLAFDTNVRGTHNVLRLCQAIGCGEVVFMSSAHVYGISPRYMPTDENHPLALHDVYTTTKILGEQLCELFYQNHGIAYTTLRLFNCYGPGQSKDYFLGVKLAQAAAGKLTLRNGDVTKDWVHVSDVVRAIWYAWNTGYVGPVNIGTGVETSLKAIVGELAKAYSCPVENEDVPAEGPTRMCADIRRAGRALTWAPQVKFQDGLAQLIESSKAAA